MALTSEQIETVEEVITGLNNEVNGIIEAREDVIAALRLDTVDDANIEAMNVIQNAKARAIICANNLVTVLS